jgi:NAD(P)H-hydrate epimerase
MLQQSTATIGADRFGAVEQLASKWGGVVVLKGWGTLIGSAGAPIAVCPNGNSAMAVGGMGDILAGVIGALLAQGLNVRRAAEAGAVIHGLCGDRARREIGPLGVLPSDVTDRIPRALADCLEN